MKSIFYKLIITLSLGQSCYAQTITEHIQGSWGLSSDYEFPDVIIFRSDGKYFVYNSNSVNTESIGLKENLKGNDILINGVYTSMTEMGVWNFNPSTKKLLLKERKILQAWTDFSETYGKSFELNFNMTEITDSLITICYEKNQQLLCDKYEKNWSYISSKGDKMYYKEILKEISGVGSMSKDILLSGYETELELSFEFYKEPDELIIYDQNNKVLHRTGIRATTRVETATINLSGITKLVFKIESEEATSKWKISVDVK